MDKKLFKSLILLITYCILLIAIIVKLDWFIGFISTVFALFSPFFIGIGIAFVLNGPFCFFKGLLDKLIKNKKMKKLIMPVTLTTVYLLFLSVIALIMFLIIPQLAASSSLLVSNFNSYMKNLEKLFNKVSDYFNIDTTIFLTFEKLVQEAINHSSQLITGIFPHVFDFTKNLASSVTNVLVGFIMSIYMLASKDRLLRQVKGILYAFIPKKVADTITEITAFSSNIFERFINGRLLDALIVGILCFTGMSIFRISYPLLISVIVAFTNVIPIFGPFLGAIPSVFILLMINPMHALWFTIFIIILQQIDGNFIGPKVVGDSIGLPALWTMLSIFVGGGLFGILGMLIGVPIFAIIYALFKKATLKRLVKKEFGKEIK